MSDIVKSSLTALIAGERPSPSAIQACFTAIMDGDVDQAQMAAFLIALKMRGEQVDDIAAAAGVMRDKALKIHASDDAMDIVGTGGDGFGTYNISTASAFPESIDALDIIAPFCKSATCPPATNAAAALNKTTSW